MYVSTLSEGTFGEKRFREVVITNGVLGRVEPKALLGSVLSLQEIDLESNYLTYFPAEEIPLYTNLESLNLRGNKLTSLANILSQTLMDVKLDGNPMGHVPVDFLQDVPELQIFSCSSCGLTEIQTGTFTRGPQLRFVDLGYNELTFLPEGAFDLAPFDSMLVLSDNKLSSVAKGAINGVTFELEIQDNQFEQLYEDVWRPVFENTTNVSLYKNPLLCDCDTAWLITDQDIVYKYLGIGDCKNGTYFHELDPAYYEEMC
ncbi:oplophorus-luciferin 2-monooxygenase non-catalytic subunit-like [Macrobrachium nipponense]|uniref:oplophorus-luciferin 2-monooxygenase non-catalytic subunit-like n=1 Tax=Macrobrachium nipponense TaxID=159736 RepID=UPI0030C8092D